MFFKQYKMENLDNLQESVSQLFKVSPKMVSGYFVHVYVIYNLATFAASYEKMELVYPDYYYFLIILLVLSYQMTTRTNELNFSMDSL